MGTPKPMLFRRCLLRSVGHLNDVGKAIGIKNDIPEEMNENFLLVFKSELFYWGSRSLYKRTSSEIFHHGNWDVISIPLNRGLSECA